MEMDIIVLGVSHYDMSGDGGSKGAKIQIFGGQKVDNYYSGVSISASEIDYEEIGKIASVQLPATFKAKFELVSIKKKNGTTETGLKFTNLRYLNTLELKPVKSA